VRHTIESSIVKAVRRLIRPSAPAMRRPSALPTITPTRLSLLQRLTGFGDSRF